MLNYKFVWSARMAVCGFIMALGLVFLPANQALSQASGNARAPLVLAAEEIILDEQTAAPYTEQGFTFTPASAVRDWVRTRLRADGTPGTIRVILLDAGMQRQELKVRGGIRGWFTDDQKYRYDGRIHLRVVHQPAGGMQMPSQAEAQASGYFTMPEDATLNQLETKAAEMVTGMMQRAALELENNMLRHMPGVVR
jgi:hypothetical protein